MKTSEKVDVILPALLKVKSKLGAVAKSSDNPYFKSKYADLNSHIELVEPLLQENGMMLTQSVLRDDRGDFVETRITHTSGQFVASTMSLVLVKQDMQAAGSAVTYARRYTLGALLSMRAEDDDGEVASGRGKSTPAAKAAESTEERPTRKSSFRKPKTETKTEAPVENGSSKSEEVDGWN